MKDSLLNTSFYNEMLTSKISRREIFMNRLIDDGTVTWKSCFNMYVINFSKHEVQTFYQPNSFHYIIDMNVFDNIGIPYFSVQFTEFDVVELIANIVSQVYDICEFGGRETVAFPMIWLNKSIGSITDTIFIDLMEIPNFPDEIPFGESLQWCELYQEPRIINFSIKFYNKQSQQMQKSLSVPVSVTEALDIVDCLLTIVADISLPSDQEELLTAIVESLDIM